MLNMHFQSNIKSHQNSWTHEIETKKNLVLPTQSSLITRSTRIIDNRIIEKQLNNWTEHNKQSEQNKQNKSASPFQKWNYATRNNYSKEPDLELEGLLKRHYTTVEFFQGTMMNAVDLERVKVFKCKTNAKQIKSLLSKVKFKKKHSLNTQHILYKKNI